MTNPYDRPRVYINWASVRPAGWRGWLTAIGVTAFAFAFLALIAIVASTLFLIALAAAVIGAVALFIGSLFHGRKNDVGPYRGNYDA